jgi:uncharacterized membrane protein
MKENNKYKIFHDSFVLGILLKGIDGIMEVIGGFLLILINPARLHILVTLLTHLIILALFNIYQIYRYTHTHSIILIILTILNFIIIILTLIEYKRIKTDFV